MTVYTTLPENTTFEETDRGGAVHCDVEIAVPGDVYPTPSGVSFGPLFLSIPPGGVCSLSKLRFVPEGDSVLGSFIGLAVVGTAGAEASPTEAEDGKMTRRRTLTLAACVLGGAALAEPVAAEDTVRFPIAEVEFTELTGPLGVNIADLGGDVLPHTTDIRVDSDGGRRRTAGGPRDGALIPPGSTTATVYLEDSLGAIREVVAWTRGVIAGAADVQYEFTLPQPATEYDPGTELTLTKHPAIVEPVEYGGHGDTILTVGGTSVPHRREDSSTTGAYYLADGGLMYRVGEGSPESDSVRIRLDAGKLATVRDSIGRE